MTERAIEAAIEAFAKANFLPGKWEGFDAEYREGEIETVRDDFAECIEAAIRAYLAALAEDDAAVEKIKEAMLKERAEMIAVYGKDAGMFDLWTLYSRAALRALGE